MIHCPQCGHEQVCPCDSCKRYHKPDTVPWVYLPGDLIACGKCNLTKHMDWWENAGKACGNPECSTSRFIDEETVTFGTGKLSEIVVWEFPCDKCARDYQRLVPDATVWMTDEITSNEDVLETPEVQAAKASEASVPGVPDAVLPREGQAASTDHPDKGQAE